MYRKLHVGIDRIAFSVHVGQCPRHFHVSGILGGVGEGSVLVFLPRLAAKIITRFLCCLIPLFTQGIPRCNLLLSAFGCRGYFCLLYALHGCLAVFRHIEYKTASIQHIVGIANLSLERHLFGIEVFALLTAGIAIRLGKYQRLSGHVHHPPVFGAEVKVFPYTYFFSGNFRFYDELHFGIQAFEL